LLAWRRKLARSCHLPAIPATDNQVLNSKYGAALLSYPTALLRSYADWVRRLPQAMGLLLAARSPLGRSIKVFLFGLGLVLPLGSIIWALLLWHGHGVLKRTKP
jgi:hypothetical protein